MRIVIKFPDGNVIEKSTFKKAIVIGRSGKADAVVNSVHLSRFHCKIENEDGQVYITDMGSLNGVYVDEVRIPVNTRVPYFSYKELKMGEVEVSISDLDEREKVSVSHEGISKAKLNTSARTDPKIKKLGRPKLELKKLGKHLITIVVISILTGIAWKFRHPIRSHSNATVQKNSNVPMNLTHVEDKFYSSSEYNERAGLKSCFEAEDECKQLNLSKDKGEGIVKEKGEYFIFFRPDLRLQESPYAGQKDEEEAKNIIAIASLIRSKMFTMFLKKEIGQIHLILETDKQQLYKVFRFHIKNYSTNGPEQIRLINELELIKSTSNAAPFWSEAKALIAQEALF